MSAGFDSILALTGVWLAKPSTGGGGGGGGGASPVGDHDTYPLSHRGSITLPVAITHLHITMAQWSEQPGTMEITGDSARNNQYTLNGSTANLTLRGYIGGTVFGGAVASTMTLGTMLILPDRWTLSKYWPLQEITGDSDGGASQPRRRWTWGTPTYSLSVQGTPKNATGPILSTRQQTAALAIDSVGDVNFVNGLSLDSANLSLPVLRGGRAYCSISGRYDGAVSYTAGAAEHDLSWLLINTGLGYDAPPGGAMSIDTDAQAIAATALLYSMSIFFDKSRGSRLRFTAQLRINPAS